MPTHLTVKNSRIIISFLIFIGLLCVIVGISLLVAYLTGMFALDPAKIWIFIVFEFFAIIIGGVIVVSQVINFIRPFVMLKTDDRGVYFGTGWRYQLFFIPWSEVDKAELDKSNNFPLFAIFKNCDSVYIHFKPSEKIPASMATSAGIFYIGYNLTLDGNYINVPATEIVEFINNYPR